MKKFNLFIVALAAILCSMLSTPKLTAGPLEVLPIDSVSTLTAYAHSEVRGISGGIYGNLLSSSSEKNWFWSMEKDSSVKSELDHLGDFNSFKFAVRVLDPNKQSYSYVTLHNVDGETLFHANSIVSYEKKKKGEYRIVSEVLQFRLADYVPIHIAKDEYVPTNAYILDENGNWLNYVYVSEIGVIYFPTAYANGKSVLIVGYTNIETGEWSEHAYIKGQIIPENAASGRAIAWMPNYFEQSDDFVSPRSHVELHFSAWAGNDYPAPTARLKLSKARWVKVSSHIYGPDFVEQSATVWFRRNGASFEEACDLVNGKGEIYLQPGIYIVYPETSLFDMPIPESIPEKG